MVCDPVPETLNSLHPLMLCLCFTQEANKPPDSWFELKVNTHVYVSGLPDDVTVEEVSKKLLFLVI